MILNVKNKTGAITTPDSACLAEQLDSKHLGSGIRLDMESNRTEFCCIRNDSLTNELKSVPGESRLLNGGIGKIQLPHAEV